MRLGRLVAVALTLLCPATGRGQTVQGVVVDAADHPVSGVVVALLDSTSKTAARSLTNDRGEFRLTATRGGMYRLRTQRIGFRPVVSDPVVLLSGGQITQRIVVTSVVLGLDTVHVAGQNVCRAFSDSGAATYAVWEQIRTALTAAELTAGARTILATTVAYERDLDLRGGRNAKPLRQSATVSTDYVTRAWRTLAPDSLHRGGYVVASPDNSTTYYLPGLDMLLSPIFVADHCFKLVDDRRQSSRLGIAFEPIPERRRGAAEIRGTLWVDGATAELRQLEFRYVNLQPAQEDQAAGAVEFARMRDGAWAVSRWEVRMPVDEQVVIPGHGAEMRVTGLHVNSGQLALARRGGDTLWAGPLYLLHGYLLDSASRRPVGGALVVLSGVGHEARSDARGRFELGDMVAGPYTLEIHTPSLDSMLTVHRSTVTLIDSMTFLELEVPSAQQLATAMCGKSTRGGSAGIITGAVRLQATGVRGARVLAEWATDSSDATRASRAESASGADGVFRICGVPTQAAISLRATSDSGESADLIVTRFAPATRLAHADITLERMADLAARGATFTGIVVSDSTHAPIAGAEVAFPDLSKSTLTDERGHFRVLGIPAGEQRLVVRRLGFGAADTRVTFTGHETVERRVVLGRAIVLDPVTVSERATDRTMPGFEENRRVGLGHFLTRVELEKYTGMTLATAMQQVQGWGMNEGRGHYYPSSRLAPSCGVAPSVRSESGAQPSGHCYVPTASEIQRGIRTSCYAQVYVDEIRMNGMNEPTEPFDIATIAPEQVEAIEYYASAAQTPMKYSTMASACGVLVIWLRR